jgi:hypothetical protein
MGLYTTKPLQLSAPAEKQIGKKFEIKKCLKNALATAIFQQLIIKLWTPIA